MRTKLFIYSAVLAAFTVGAAPADAKPKYHHNDHDDHRHYDRHDHDHDRYRHRSREVYFIERNRPVKRVVYINPGGGYYRIVNGRRVVVRERYYESYPSRYFYPDGRRRVGISFSF